MVAICSGDLPMPRFARSQFRYDRWANHPPFHLMNEPEKCSTRQKKTWTEIFGLGGNWEIGIRLLICSNSCAGSRFYTIFTWAGLCQRTDTRHTPSHATSSSAKKDDVEIVGESKLNQLFEFGAPPRISANCNGTVVVRTSVLPKDVSSSICLFRSNCKNIHYNAVDTFSQGRIKTSTKVGRGQCLLYMFGDVIVWALAEADGSVSW